MMPSTVLDRNEVTSPLEVSDPDKVAHIVLEGFGNTDGSEFKSAQELGLPGGSVVESFVFGKEIVALCGQKLIAQNNPENRPLCQACVEVAKQMGWKVPGS
jgi:hypothetical protein